MKGSRLFQTLKLYLTLSAAKRTAYLKKKGVFGAIGEHCTVMDRKVPLYAKLIRLGDNVQLASNVTFVTHDITHKMLNNAGLAEADGTVFREKTGCIEIGNNVFVGTGTTILYDTKIGSNVIIAAGSVVTKDIPDNSVVAGIPAKVLESFDTYLEKRRKADAASGITETPKNQEVSPALAALLWKEFEEKHA